VAVGQGEVSVEIALCNDVCELCLQGLDMGCLCRDQYPQKEGYCANQGTYDGAHGDDVCTYHGSAMGPPGPPPQLSPGLFGQQFPLFPGMTQIGVGVGLGVMVGRGVRVGIDVNVGRGVNVGIDVDVGLCVNVGMGVDVGCGVRHSGRLLPLAHGSVVGVGRGVMVGTSVCVDVG
jgi:hypothetical protein